MIRARDASAAPPGAPIVRRPCARSAARHRPPPGSARGSPATGTRGRATSHCSECTVRPIAWATRASSRMNRLLPTPGKPAKKTSDGGAPSNRAPLRGRPRLR
jgi:hypothetical protein